MLAKCIIQTTKALILTQCCLALANSATLPHNELALTAFKTTGNLSSAGYIMANYNYIHKPPLPQELRIGIYGLATFVDMLSFLHSDAIYQNKQYEFKELYEELGRMFIECKKHLRKDAVLLKEIKQYPWEGHATVAGFFCSVDTWSMAKNVSYSAYTMKNTCRLLISDLESTYEELADKNLHFKETNADNAHICIYQAAKQRFLILKNSTLTFL